MKMYEDGKTVCMESNTLPDCKSEIDDLTFGGSIQNPTLATLATLALPRPFVRH